MTDFVTEDTRLAVKKGAVWMDQEYPDWVRKINIENLDMNNCHSCIIGQTMGDYFKLIDGGRYDGAFYDEEWAIDHGFTVSEDVTYHESFLLFHQLETLWTDEVERRLG